MNGGLFYQPKSLATLSKTELRDYAVHCGKTIQKNADEGSFIAGQFDVLSEGRLIDSALTFGGLALAGVGIVGVTVFTATGGLALLGGAAGLWSTGRMTDRLMRRATLKARLDQIRQSTEFCRNEQTRIADELKRRP